MLIDGLMGVGTVVLFGAFFVSVYMLDKRVAEAIADLRSAEEQQKQVGTLTARVAELEQRCDEQDKEILNLMTLMLKSVTADLHHRVAGLREKFGRDAAPEVAPEEADATSNSDSPSYIQKQDANSGVSAFFGKWPGDETDEEIRAAMEKLS